MRPGLLVLALIASGHSAGAEPVDLNGKGLETCLQTARSADQACAKLTDQPAQRLDCFQNARTAELECLEQALSPDTPAASAVPESPSAAPQPEQPSAAASPDAARPEVSKEEAPASPPDSPTGSIAGQEPKTVPAESAPRDRAPAANAEPPPPTEAPRAPPAAAAIAAAPADVPNEAGLRGAADWVVSETTSPVDYSPLFSALIRPASRLHDGPSSLAVRCRRGRTELSVRNESGWRPTRSGALLIDHRINKQPIVRLMWSLSADEKTATYGEDAVELLRALPDGALLSISVPDGDNARRESTFLPRGWDAIRQKLASLCNWPSPTGRSSQVRR